METEVLSCPFCSYPTIEAFYFCPHCGKSLKPTPISAFKQIGIYLLSFFLPPLGLWPGIKYLRQNNKKAKVVGAIAVILTLIATVATIWFTIDLVNQINKSLSGQINPDQFKNLGL